MIGGQLSEIEGKVSPWYNMTKVKSIEIEPGMNQPRYFKMQKRQMYCDVAGLRGVAVS